MSTEAFTPERLLGMARAFHECRVLLTAAELDLFTRLAPEPLSAEEVVARLHGELRPARVVLDALAALGLLTKQDGRYQTPAALAPLLSSGPDHPRSVLPMVRHAAAMWRTWTRLTDLVRGEAEPTPPASETRSDEDLKAFIGAMHVIGRGMAEQIVAAMAPEGATALLDVGGGPSTYTQAFLRANPEARATLFDLPEVIPMARENLERAGLAGRVTLVAGDYLTDALPGGHDLALLSAIIHSNSLAENEALYRKIHAALVPGGRLIIRDHIMSPDRTSPPAGAMFAVNMLVATAGGGTWTLDEIRTGLEAAGFTGICLLQDGPRMDGLVEATRP